MSKNDTLSSCPCVCPYKADETDIANNMHWNFFELKVLHQEYIVPLWCVSLTLYESQLQ